MYGCFGSKLQEHFFQFMKMFHTVPLHKDQIRPLAGTALFQTVPYGVNDKKGALLQPAF